MVGNAVIKFMPKSIMLSKMHQNKINFHDKFDQTHLIQNNIEKGKDFKNVGIFNSIISCTSFLLNQCEK